MRHQFIVSADFNNGSLMKHHDHVGLTNGRQTVGDEKDGAVVEVVEVVADLPFGFVVEALVASSITSNLGLLSRVRAMATHVAVPLRAAPVHQPLCCSHWEDP